ncbi:MAG: DUF177 domain-containing protein [Oscillospiraceae bacterium]|nr:DUF177 domain-containing protein [Oscillospiraceae bacterium]
MIIELGRFFEATGDYAAFAHPMDVSGVEIWGVRPFLEPVLLKGEIKNHAGVVTISYTAEFTDFSPCDRCGAQINRPTQYKFNHTLVTTLEGEEVNDLILVENNRLDLDDLALSDILLELPSKHLCTAACKGLCPKCGTNLNQGECGCEKHEIDPRLAVLKTLLN